MTDRRGRLMFAGLALAFLTLNFVWLRLDRSPATWDDAVYLSGSVSMYDTLTDSGVGAFLRKSLHVTTIRPPLITMLPAPV